MGDFIIRIPYSPAEYRSLQVRERDAILTAWNEAQKQSP